MFCPGYQISVKIVSSTATGGLLKTTLRSYLKKFKMSIWYQFNPKVFLFTTASRSNYYCMLYKELYITDLPQFQ